MTRVLAAVSLRFDRLAMALAAVAVLTWVTGCTPPPPEPGTGVTTPAAPEAGEGGDDDDRPVASPGTTAAPAAAPAAGEDVDGDDDGDDGDIVVEEEVDEIIESQSPAEDTTADEASSGESDEGDASEESVADSSDEAPAIAAPKPGDRDYKLLTPVTEWLPEPIPNEDAVAETADQMKPYTEKIPDTDATVEMVPIPGGEFLMGSPETEADRGPGEGPQVKVKIEPFWMQAHEVTWNQYELWGMGLDQQRRKILGIPKSERHDLIDAITVPTKPYTDMTFGMGKDQYPAICMTQFAAKAYCKWLSAKTGRYYRLPTEAEWEYACRAGSTTAYSFGDDPDDLDDYAWYYDNADDQYQEVGQKKPNKWGLYDMHGNVAEWVIDAYDEDFYAKAKQTEPNEKLVNIPKTMYPRTVRGGSWDDDPPALRSAARRGSNKDWKMQDPQIPQSVWYHTEATFVGFRVVRPLKVPPLEEALLYEADDPQKIDWAEYKEAQAGKM